MRSDWRPALDIPEGKQGKFRIEHRVFGPGEAIPLINQRTAIFRGCKPANIKYDVPVRFHYLTEDGGTWTSDVPQEQEQQARAVMGFTGEVLVGGLGIGMIAHILAEMRMVRRIVIVEKQKEVIDLVWPHIQKELHGKGEIVHANLFQYLRETDENFNYAFYDIWTSDGERTLKEYVLPLRKLSERIVEDDHIKCWNEDVMWGQIHWGLHSKCAFAIKEMKAMGEKQFKYWDDDITGPFWRWVRDKDIKKNRAVASITRYVEQYQKTRAWKRTWEAYV